MTYTTGTNILKFISYAFLIFLLMICILPVWILLVNATRTTTQIQNALSLIPGTNMINNFNTIVKKGLYLKRGFYNSVIISFSTTFLSVYFSLMTAYAINVYDFKFKKEFYAFIVLMVLIPAQLSITGLYQYVSSLKLLNSYIPIIIPSIASAGTVFFAKQYFDAALIPELLQAARIDGASEFSIYNKIALPIAAPGAFTMAIFAFVGSWNNFLVPFTLISKQKKYTLPMLMSLLRGDTYRTDYGGIYLGMAITVIPIIIVYVIFSKYIVSGISMGAVKE